MEQHGVPGKVHISQATRKCLGDEYIVEDSGLENRDKDFMSKLFFKISKFRQTDSIVNKIYR